MFPMGHRESQTLWRLSDPCFRDPLLGCCADFIGSQEVKDEEDFSLSLAFLAKTYRRSCL